MIIQQYRFIDASIITYFMVLRGRKLWGKLRKPCLYILHAHC